MGALVMLLALKAFALGASGSVAVLASVVETGLELLALISSGLVLRWARRTSADADTIARAQAGGDLVQIGLALAAALVLGWLGFWQILQPRAIDASIWALCAMGLALALVIVGVIARFDRVPRPSILADPAPTFVAGLGMAAASWLAAPGLDGAAAMVIAVWLGWGAVGRIRPALEVLMAPPAADPSAAETAPVSPSASEDAPPTSSVPFT